MNSGIKSNVKVHQHNPNSRPSLMPVDHSLESLQGSLRQMLTWFLSPKSLGLEQDGEHAVHMVANHLAQGYAVLNDALNYQPSTEVEIQPFDKVDYQGTDRDYLAPVVELGERVNSEIAEFVTDFMIHGSIATLDYSRGWSDFDTFVIVSTDTALNGRALTALRTKLLDAYKFLTAVDPLQHHGFILCTDIDLKRYYEDTMPLEVFRRAKSYLGTRTLQLNPIKNIDRERNILASRAQFFRKAGEMGVMNHHAYDDVYLQSHYRNAENGLFQFKYLLGIGAIAPCYYRDAIGNSAYKKDAIEQVAPLLSKSSRKFLESITHIRNEWPKRQEFPYKGNRIPEWFKEFVEPDYIVNLGNLLTELEHLAGTES
jgi:hypothetical protein